MEGSRGSLDLEDDTNITPPLHTHTHNVRLNAVFREPERLRLLSCSSLIVISAAKLNVNITASWGKVETLVSWIMTLGFLLDILKLPCLRAAE